MNACQHSYNTFFLKLRHTLTVAVCLVCSINLVSAETVTLTSETWSIPRTGDVLLKLPEFVAVMQAIEKMPASPVRIRYPGGDEGSLWAHEVRSWLITLGISGKQIELLPGSSAADHLDIELAEGIKELAPAPLQVVK